MDQFISSVSIVLFCLSPCVSNAQNYTSWSIGNTSSVDVDHEMGLVLMGGAGEMPEAMVWFLERAAGGDILVLRVSGSDAYNDYLYSDLGVDVNRVETIRCNNPNSATEPYILERIAEAEAVWLAGGDQHDYVQFWKDTPIEDALHALVNGRGGAIGGISAGLAVLGFGYFAASNGTVYSGSALSDPYNEDMDVRYGDFLRLPFMNTVITDSHYDDPDRKGRHVAFLSRLVTDHNIAALGIGCNEYTAVCIGEDGFAHCYGEYPQYPEQVYFLRPACLDVPAPFCQPGTPLDWGFEGGALNVYVVDATEQGNRGLDLNDWSTGIGGEWENWWVEDGELIMSDMLEEPVCSSSSVNSVIDLSEVELEFIEIKNSSGGYISIRLPISTSITILDMSGRIVQNLGEMSAGEHLVRGLNSAGCFIVSSENKELQSVVFCD
ncbi:MAG: Type 1 glutamine amidotransferase-like domain-containing protein [Bacteroidetes bacterium]|nr:Type 1 glutamine amidotransferase-like domain-containing protein [Bacteroidota bacterium]MDA0980496.1 Type 1 glutamine amidotransferase-like domain-containing protein [Bacteroidota bacterium]